MVIHVVNRDHYKTAGKGNPAIAGALSPAAYPSKVDKYSVPTALYMTEGAFFAIKAIDT